MKKTDMHHAATRKLLWPLLMLAASTAHAGPAVFSAPLLDGGRFESHEYLGKRPVLLKFWATWCAACLEEMPAYRELHARLGNDVAFLAVNVAVNDPLQKVRAAVRDHQLEMPIAYDGAGRLWKQFDVIGTPMYVLVDRDGTVAYKTHRHDEKLERAVRTVARDQRISSPHDERAVAKKPLMDIDGNLVSLTAEPGETIVAYHFATWCETYLLETDSKRAAQCRQFREALTELAARDVPRTRFIGLATRYSSNVESVREYRERHGVDHALVFDETGVFAERFGVRDFPHLVLVRDGAVIHSTSRVEPGLAARLRDATISSNFQGN